MITRGKIHNPKFISVKPRTMRKAAQLPNIKSRRSTHKRSVKPCPRGHDVCHCR